MTPGSRFRNFLIAAALGVCAVYSGILPAEAAPYVQTNLVSDIAGLAVITDPSLRNPWGVSRSGTSPFWVSDQATNLSTLYNVTGAGVTKNALTVTIPTTASGPQGPTGQVSNVGGSTFLVNGSPASFIFADLNGTISAWNNIPVGNTSAQIVKPSSGDVYTGLAINTGMTRLYAANDAGTGSIDVYSGSFAELDLGPGAFQSPFPGLVPFGVQDIGGKVYVAYAVPGLAAMRSAPEGSGGVAVYDENGTLLQTLISGSKLASPWGIALAPAGFGLFGGDLLVGNFSFVASEINAFDPVSGAFLGTIPIDDGGNGPGGLWALIFGNGGNGGNPNTLYFTDGIAGEAHGLFAAITFVPEPSSLALLGAAFVMFGIRRAREWR